MIKSPVIIVGCARSGSTLLYHILSEVDSLWSIGVESRPIIEHYHHPSSRDWVSGELSAEDLTAESREYILDTFESQAAPGSYWQGVHRLRARLNRSPVYMSIKRRGQSSSVGSGASSKVPGGGLEFLRKYARFRNWIGKRLSRSQKPIRLLDKSIEHCLRLPFIAALFPDAKVIFLVRDGRSNIYSMMEVWRQPHRFGGYNTPIPVTSPGQSRGRWIFPLIPGWRDLVDRPLEEICAQQWLVCNETVLEYCATPGSLPVLMVRYEDLIGNSDVTLDRIADFLDLAPEDIPARGSPLPNVNVISQPGTEKWRREEETIAGVMPILRPMMERLGYEEEVV